MVQLLPSPPHTTLPRVMFPLGKEQVTAAAAFGEIAAG